MINKETSDLKKIDPWTTMVPFIAIFILCLFFIVKPKESTDALSFIRNFIGDTFGTYYLIIGLGVLFTSLMDFIF